jgi:hypothetical protein
MRIAKTRKSTYWHIVYDEINETLCGKSVYNTWIKRENIVYIPGSVCKECKELKDELEKSSVRGAKADKTDPHFSW